eukprot:COSAG02_NODE_20_length_53673_cov_86.864841_36_plen_138_part_00
MVEFIECIPITSVILWCLGHKNKVVICPTQNFLCFSYQARVYLDQGAVRTTGVVWMGGGVSVIAEERCLLAGVPSSSEQQTKAAVVRKTLSPKVFLKKGASSHRTQKKCIMPPNYPSMPNHRRALCPVRRGVIYVTV